MIHPLWEIRTTNEFALLTFDNMFSSYRFQAIGLHQGRQRVVCSHVVITEWEEISNKISGGEGFYAQNEVKMGPLKNLYLILNFLTQRIH